MPAGAAGFRRNATIHASEDASVTNDFVIHVDNDTPGRSGESTGTGLLLRSGR